MKVLNLIWQMMFVEITSLSCNTRLVTTAYALCMVLFFFGMACYCVFYKDSIFLNFAVLFVLYSNNCEMLVHVVVLEAIWPSFGLSASLHSKPSCVLFLLSLVYYSSTIWHPCCCKHKHQCAC